MHETDIIESQEWCCLSVRINIHIKKALIGILHNTIHDPTITPLPSEPRQLFVFMLTNKNTLELSLRRKI